MLRLSVLVPHQHTRQKPSKVTLSCHQNGTNDKFSFGREGVCEKSGSQEQSTLITHLFSMG